MSETATKDTDCINLVTSACRICTKQTNNSIDLFNGEHNGKKFVEMLSFCLKRSIHQNDGLPGTICTECGTNLITVHAFHTLCLDSEHHFRRLFSSTENKVKVEVDSELDEPCENRVKIESEGHIVVLPDISYFHNEHFDTQKQSNEEVSDSDYSDYKSKSMRKSLKKSKKLREQKRLHRLSAERQASGLFECFECKKTFNRFSNLQRHASSHAKKDKTYVCSECHIKFVYLKSLFRHRRQKHADRVYECEYCTEAFESLSKLKHHINGVHKQDSKTYKCDVCSKTFLLHFQLLCHQTEDVCTQNFQCTDCDEAFPLHRMLKTHIRDKHTSKC